MANVAAAQIYDRVGYYYDGLALVEGYTSANGWSKKYGYVNQYNKLVIPLKYEGAGNFCEGIAAVKIGLKYGYINTKGAAVTPLIYDEVYNFQEGFGKVGINGKYGCVNKSGKLVIPCKYDEIRLRDDMFYTEADGKEYIFDKNGRNIVPQGYNFVCYINKDNNGNTIWCVEKNGKYGAVDFSSKMVVECKYDKVGWAGDCGISLKLGDKYGCMLIKNKKMIPFEYDEIEGESYDDGSCHIKAWKGKYFTYYDSNGERELPGLYRTVKYYEQIVQNENGKCGYLGKFSKINEVSFEYDTLIYYRESNNFYKINKDMYYAKKDGKWGFVKHNYDVDKKIDELVVKIPCEYDDIERYGYNNLFFLYKGDYTGLINWKEDSYDYVPCIYEDFEFYGSGSYSLSGSYAIAKKNGKYGIISIKNEIIVDFCMDKKPKKVSRGIMMEIDGKVGVTDVFQNEIEIPYEYEIFEPSDGMIRVKKNNTYSFVTEDYEFASYYSSHSYDDKDVFIGQYFYFNDAKDFHEGVAAVKQGSLWGYASKGFSWVIMPKFDEAGDFKDGKALVRKGKKEYYIGKDGKKIK